MIEYFKKKGLQDIFKKSSMSDIGTIDIFFKRIVVDEVDFFNNSQFKMPKSDLIKGVIETKDSLNGINASACPCCGRYLPIDDCQKCTTIEDSNTEYPRSSPQFEENGHNSQPGTLLFSNEYKFKKVLVKGWLHKKRTGGKWISSRSWTPRFAKLMLASIPGFSIDVPLLLIYWHSSSNKPSNFVSLIDSTVLPLDRLIGPNDKAVQWNTYYFDVVYTGKGSGETQKMTFALPKDERNNWVFLINQAILDYEKNMNKERAKCARIPSTSVLRSRSKIFDSKDSLPPISPQKYSTRRRETNIFQKSIPYPRQ